MLFSMSKLVIKTVRKTSWHDVRLGLQKYLKFCTIEGHVTKTKIYKNNCIYLYYILQENLENLRNSFRTQVQSKKLLYN